MALSNVSVLLARWGFRILIVDWDLEAPGLESFFKDVLDMAVVKQRRGVIDILDQEFGGCGDMSWKDFVLPVPLPQTNDNLHLITAGRVDERYFQRVRGLDVQELYAEHHGGDLLESLRNEWIKNYDFVLIDSRTGITDIGSICTIHLPDILVLLITPTDQAFYGTIDVARRVDAARQRLPFERTRVPVVPIPSRLDKAEFELVQEWLHRFSTELAELYVDWLPTSVQRRDLLAVTQLPYISYFSFGEKLPVLEQGTFDPGGLGYAYENLAGLIANNLNNVGQLIEDRARFMRAAMSSRVKKPSRVVVAHSHKDTFWVNALVRHLRGVQGEWVLDVWSDERLSVGHDWFVELKEALSEAAIVIVLISPDFLASGFIQREEILEALKGGEGSGARLVPVLLKPSALNTVPALGALEALPLDGTPLALENGPRIESRLVGVVTEIFDLLESSATVEVRSEEGSKQRPYDVFVSYSSREKLLARQLSTELKQRGVRVWLDEWELTPGHSWQDALDTIINTAMAAILLIGKSDLGSWEVPEQRALLVQFVKRELPVIPVLLPGAPSRIDLPLFLRERSWVDLRGGFTEEGLDRLEWGITGRRPTRTLSPEVGAPSLHNLPFPPLGHLFRGRAGDLQKLAIKGDVEEPVSRYQAIHGLGGIGKTRLAVEYAWRYGDRYNGVFFVYAGSPEALRIGLAGLAGPALLDLPEYEERSEERVVGAVLRWLRENLGWLLIFDNVDTEEAAAAIRKLLPALSGGRVLITSRLREWPAAVQRQALDTLTAEDSAQFLLQRTEGERQPEVGAVEQAMRLAEVLGGLPLALEQAAAYISYHQMSFSDYLKAWQLQREAVLEWHDPVTMQYPTSLAAIWEYTFRQLSFSARAVLRLTAFFAPDAISVEMFDEGGEIVDMAEQLLSTEIGEESVVRFIREPLAELAAYSMITRQGKTFTVHRLVQEVLRFRVPGEQRKSWITLCLNLLVTYLPFDSWDVRTWPVWDLLLPHALRVLEYADREGIKIPTVNLASRLGSFLFAKGLYSEAEPVLRRALVMAEESFGGDHPEVSRGLDNLAQLLQATNRLSEAEPMMRRALEIDQAAFGEQHPNIAVDLNNLASLLQATNRLSEAEPMIRRALEIDQAAFGEHPNVATHLNNLASLLQATNRLSEAEPMMRRALEIDQAAFGDQHPSIARDLNNLALLLQATNRLSEAEPMMRRALEINEAVFGGQHPVVARDLNNLTKLLHDKHRAQDSGSSTSP
jgi:tetratricopeptide (TPR) repeat protein